MISCRRRQSGMLMEAACSTPGGAWAPTYFRFPGRCVFLAVRSILLGLPPYRREERWRSGDYLLPCYDNSRYSHQISSIIYKKNLIYSSIGCKRNWAQSSEQPKFGHNLVRKRHKIGHTFTRERPKFGLVGD